MAAAIKSDQAVRESENLIILSWEAAMGKKSFHAVQNVVYLKMNGINDQKIYNFFHKLAVIMLIYVYGT